jgi:hypothetical protein
MRKARDSPLINKKLKGEDYLDCCFGIFQLHSEEVYDLQLSIEDRKKIRQVWLLIRKPIIHSSPAKQKG